MLYHSISNQKKMESLSMNASRTPSILRWFSLLLLSALLLSACAPAVTQVPSTPPPSTPTATNPPAPTATSVQSEPTAQTTNGTIPAMPPTKASEVTTYKLVPGESKVSYEVGETFLNQNNRYNLAKGITTQVTGEITGDKNNPAAARIGAIQIDISQFKSDNDRRDGYIRSNGLESSKYPMAKFTPTKIDALPAAYQEGSQVSFKITGDLTIKETTRPVTWNVTSKLTGTTLSGQATTEILMSDFKVGPISIMGILNTEDKVKLTFDFVARP
jgi:polyisoprenoid-binding protein YceI